MRPEGSYLTAGAAGPLSSAPVPLGAKENNGSGCNAAINHSHNHGQLSNQRGGGAQQRREAKDRPPRRGAEEDAAVEKEQKTSAATGAFVLCLIGPR